MDRNRLALLSATEQDESECLRWWREASGTDKRRVWDAIQTSYDDPVMEIVSRFAQPAFSQMALKADANRSPTLPEDVP